MLLRFVKPFSLDKPVHCTASPNPRGLCQGQKDVDHNLLLGQIQTTNGSNWKKEKNFYL